MSLATSYRILQSLADDGLVDVLRNADGEAVYRRCAVTGHHHHLLCRNCGKAVEVEAPAVEAWAARIAKEHGFTAVEHTVEIFGLCPECTAAARPAVAQLRIPHVTAQYRARAGRRWHRAAARRALPRSARPGR